MVAHAMVPCGHWFCGECLAGWLGNGRKDCPSCRCAGWQGGGAFKPAGGTVPCFFMQNMRPLCC